MTASYFSTGENKSKQSPFWNYIDFMHNSDMCLLTILWWQSQTWHNGIKCKYVIANLGVSLGIHSNEIVIIQEDKV